MLVADDAEMLRGDRLAVLAHRRQQLGDAVAVDLIDAEELRQRLVRAADLVEHLALNGSPGKPAELGDELAHRAMLAAGRDPWPRARRDNAAAVSRRTNAGWSDCAAATSPSWDWSPATLMNSWPYQDPAQSQVRIEPDIALSEPFELRLARNPGASSLWSGQLIVILVPT